MLFCCSYFVRTKPEISSTGNLMLDVRTHRHILLKVHETDHHAFQEVRQDVHQSAIPILWAALPAIWSRRFLPETALRRLIGSRSQLATGRVTIFLKRAIGRHCASTRHDAEREAFHPGFSNLVIPPFTAQRMNIPAGQA